MHVFYACQRGAVNKIKKNVYNLLKWSASAEVPITDFAEQIQQELLIVKAVS